MNKIVLFIERTHSRRFLVKLDVDRSVVGHTLNTMESVQVLVHGDLEHRSTSLSEKKKKKVCKSSTRKQKDMKKSHIPADNGAVRQEEDPDSVPSVTVNRGHLVLVADPVLVPSVNGGRVVDTEDVNVLDFKASTFELELE